MCDWRAHRDEVIALGAPLGTEDVPLAAARGRWLARDVRALADAPGFDNSSMDGYAVRAADAEPGSSGAWDVAHDGRAGSTPPPLAPGTVARIMTGAPLPDGADAVVPVEATDGGLARVRVDAWPRPGAFVRARGSDALAGDLVVASGRVLGPGDLAAAAAAGTGTLGVAIRPRVGLLTTGDEVLEPGAALAPGQIHDANGPALAALVEAWGGEVAWLERARDDEREVLRLLDAGSGVDAIVTAGAVSAGASDVVKAALTPLGVAFAHVAMQPGKPQGWGRLHGVPIVCAPGNPVSAFVTFVAFVGPLLLAMQGRPAPEPSEAVAAEGWTTPAGRAQFMPVRVTPGGVVPATAGGSGSHLAAALAHAEALAVVPRDAERVAAGDTVGLMRLEP